MNQSQIAASLHASKYDVAAAVGVACGHSLTFEFGHRFHPNPLAGVVGAPVIEGQMNE